MRRPWQIWLLFTLCLVAVAPAMLWVTLKALELDQAELVARLQAEQEIEVSRALWSVDSRLTPLLAEEAARPDFVYQPLGSNPVELVQLNTSNTLATTPNYVLLHFELKSSGQGASPQVLSLGGKGTPDENSTLYCGRLNQLVESISYSQLLAELPEQSLPQLTLLANADLSAEQQQVVGGNTSLQSAYAAAPSQQAELNSEIASDAPVQQPARGQQAGNPSAQYGQLDGYAPNSPPGESRSGRDLRDRNAAYQSAAQRAIAQQRFNNYAPAGNNRRPVAIREGICRPVWIDDKLLFARQVERGQEKVIQGCWLDWETLRADLLPELKGLPAGADLVPLRIGGPQSGRLLATLPVQLVVPPPVAEITAWSPIRLALVAAWGCLALAAASSAWLLSGVVALSERRASFVSAVTHELRTPLTTFRMYSEMLAGDMVGTPEQRQKYLETLCVEADRLTHLVDNVLLYARLERGQPGKNRVAIRVDQLLGRFQSRLADRTEQVGLKLQVDCNEEAAGLEIVTDPAAVEQIVFNLMDNACKYAAAADDKSIVLATSVDSRFLRISVRDFGPGLSASARRRLFQPFSKTSEEAAVSAPGVGLGLALCKRLAGDLGGNLQYDPASPGARFILLLPV